MNLLLDTHTLIWFLNGDDKLSEKAKSSIENPKNIKLVSIASIWKITIKLSLGKIRFPKGFKQFLKLIEENGFEVLPITFEHAIELSTLDFIHRDPFNRLLIAQCKADNFTLISKDDIIKKYDIKLIW